MLAAPKKGQDAWLWATLALAGAVLFLLALDTVVWHAGYCRGDETDVIARVQRIREGMPNSLDLSQGSLHRLFLLASFSLWPGRLWASSVPAMLGLALEMALLFAMGKRLAGPRAGFFAVFFGALSAFTLIRARLALSLSLFPAEWLFMAWIRPYAKKPWQWALWGGVLGLCCFDYEAWLPSAVLLLLWPFPEEVPWRQRAWELLGLAALIACILPPDLFFQYLRRRHAASLVNQSSPSAGWSGVLDLIWGGRTLPYMAPTGHGIFPLWYWLLLPLGLWSWRQRLWAPLACLGLGIVLPLMGGAPYGLPAHRGIAAWPMLALIVGVGAERLASLAPEGRIKPFLICGLALIAGQQLWAWQDSQNSFDLEFRGITREMKQAASAAWQHSQETGFPLVTDLHPMAGAQFRFLTGHAVPLPDAKAATVVAFVAWDYLPAVRKHWGQVATFQEGVDIPPVYVMVLNGPLAKQALEAELAYRPLISRLPQYTLKSSDLVFDWVRQHADAGPWARTLALDYVGMAEFANVRVSKEWIDDVVQGPLVSARPYLIASDSLLLLGRPDKALSCIRQGREIDPFNGRAWNAEGALLKSLGREAELQAMQKARDSYLQHHALFID